MSPELIQECYGSQMDNIRIVTLAPELTGALETIEWLDTYRSGEKEREEKRIVVSLGHSMAQFACAEMAVKSGATHITHLFNAMLPVSGHNCTQLIRVFKLSMMSNDIIGVFILCEWVDELW